MGIVNRNVFVIDFTNKTITPEVATASLEEIEFRVNNTVYIADSYMNWDNYINSDYNNGNWTLCGDLVYLNGQPVLSSHGQVYKHEIILADETYTA